MLNPGSEHRETSILLTCAVLASSSQPADAPQKFNPDVLLEQPPAAAPGSMAVLWNCNNTTMEQFAERLRNMSSELNWPILDATELAGSWDFTFSFTRNFGPPTGGGRGGDGPAAGTPSASDPTGTVTIFQALEKQLGLKLELQKWPMSVIVIDRLEEKPTEN